MAISEEEFRLAMGRFASGVTVVTTRSEDKQIQGLTVSAFLSLSLEPPLVLISIDKRASIHEHLSEGGCFAVNVLSEDQEAISRRFASRDVDRFDGIGFKEGVAGSPLLDGALARVECRIVHAYSGGDHTIFVGEVEAADVTEGKPLAYFRGGYARLS